MPVALYEPSEWFSIIVTITTMVISLWLSASILCLQKQQNKFQIDTQVAIASQREAKFYYLLRKSVYQLEHFFEADDMII